jgi:hypothetical protein
MGGVVDFSQLNQEVKPWGQVLDPITAALDQHHQEQIAKAHQQRQLDFQREQEARLAARDDSRHQEELGKEARIAQHQMAQETVQEAQRQQQADAAVRQAAGIPGNLPEAQRLAQSYVGIDPQTGTVVHGRPFSQRPNPEPQAPKEEGPQATPDIAKQAGLIRADQAAFEPNAGPDSQYTGAAQQERKRFAESQTNGDATDPQFMAQKQAYLGEKENPHVAIGGVETTPQDIRYTKSRADAADFKASLGPLTQKLAQAHETGDPQVIAAVQRQVDKANELQPLVEKGLMTPVQAASQINSAGTAEAAFEAKLGAQREHETASTERTKMMSEAAMAREAAKAAAKKEETGGIDPKAEARTEAALEHFQSNFTVKTDRADEARAKTLINNKDSAVVQRAMSSYLARGLAGERGALSDQDIKRIQGDLGGAWVDVENWLSKKGSGQLAPEVSSKLRAGIQAVLDEKTAKREVAKKAYAKTFLSPTSPYAGWGLGDHLRNKHEEIFGEPYQEPSGGGQQASPQGAAAPSKGGPTILQANPLDTSNPTVKKFMDHATANPGDPRIPQVLKKLRDAGLISGPTPWDEPPTAVAAGQ